MENVVKSQVLNEDIQYSIGTTASEIPESLRRYQPGEWPVKIINSANYNMSEFIYQIKKLAAKVKKNLILPKW